MTELRFENENNSNYMCVTDYIMSRDNDYQIKMIEKNKIPGMLPVQVRQINSQIHYYYEITAKQQMSKLFEFSKIQWGDLVLLCESLSLLVHSVNEYMLDLEYVLLAPESIFIDLAGRRFYFAYCPATFEKCSEQGFHLALRKLFEYILEHYDHDTDKEKLMCVYAAYQKIVQNQYHVDKLDELLEERSKRMDEKIQSYTENECSCGIHSNMDNQENDGVVIDTVAEEKILEEKEVYDKKLITLKKCLEIGSFCMIFFSAVCIIFPGVIPVKMPGWVSIMGVIFGGGVYLGAKAIPKIVLTKLQYEKYLQPFILNEPSKSYDEKDEESEKELENMKMADHNIKDEKINVWSGENTILLSEYLKQNKSAGIRLVSKDMQNEFGEKNIENFPCIIGSLVSRCNIVIENVLVSRLHACILRVDNIFYIEDMNSTNGTYVNGIRLETGVRKELQMGDELSIASLVYKVEIT